MPSETEVTLDQLRDILDVLRRTIEGAASLASRIDLLEKASQETFTVVVTLQQNQQRLLEGFQTHAEAQNRLNTDMAQAISQLVDRIDILEGRRRVM